MEFATLTKSRTRGKTETWRVEMYLTANSRRVSRHIAVSSESYDVTIVGIVSRRQFQRMVTAKCRNKKGYYIIIQKAAMVKRASVGADLQYLDADKFITTDPRDYSKRRALKLVKRANSWGFTLQTYGIKHKRTNEVEIMTYVDYVEIGGAAWIAGMRAGDVIVSVNGERSDHLSHQQLVSRIRQVQDTLRLVVLFEDCCKKVELHERFIKLKAVLKSKYHELKDLEMKELQVLDNICKEKGLNRDDHLRQSLLSNVSSNSDSWDAYSMISSPNHLQSTGVFGHGNWSSVSSLKSFSMEDNNSSIVEDLNYIDSESDSDGLSLPPVFTSSDTDLPSKGRAENLKVKNELLISSSDSDLYRGKIGKGPAHKKTAVGQGTKKLDNGVFINGACNRGSNSNMVNGQSAGKGDNSNGAKSREYGTGHDTQIYYAGDNGNIIVPKIVVEGDEVFTTFDHIDTNTIREKDLPSLDPNSYREKVVALEIAREMALLENLNGVSKSDKTEPNGSSDQDTGLLNTVKTAESNTEADQESADSRDLPKLLPNIKKSYSLGNKDTSDVLKTSPTLSTRSLTMNKPVVLPRVGGMYAGFSSSAPHICGSLSYDQLKSSVPDFVISFHTEKCQVIYINEQDETTQL